jgi:hypothetical protein
MVNNYNNKAMRKLKNIYWAGTVVLTLLLSQNIVAQNAKAYQTNPASIELLKATSLWFNTNNAAGLSLDKMYNYNDLKFNYNLKSGDFKRTSDGGDERTFGVSTEGGLNLGGGYVWGKFSYNNEKQTGTLYNTSMLDPLRGTPYYTVDKILSDWKKQDYNLYMKASSKPLWGKVLIGIEAQYITKTGAKQVDPRSDIDFFTFNVKPAIAATFNNHVVGLNFEYEKLNQESRTTNSNSQLSQDVFVLRGLGNYYSAVVGGLQSLKKFVYNGNKAGGAIQYSYSGESIKLLLDGKYSFRVEDVISNQTQPKKEGSVKENHYEGNLQIVKMGDNTQRAEVSYSDNKISGIEYVQYLDNSFEVHGWVTTYQSIRSTYSLKDIAFKYDFFKGKDLEYFWRAGVTVNYKNSDDLYIMPESSMKIEDLILGVNGKINFNMKKSNRLLLGLCVNYKNNMSGSYNYGGPEANSHIITDFMTPDFQYMKRSYYKLGGEVSYFTNISKNRKSGMFIKAALDYYKPTEGSDNRLLTNLGVGFNF